jgi:hypothetical protein
MNGDSRLWQRCRKCIMRRARSHDRHTTLYAIPNEFQISEDHTNGFYLILSLLFNSLGEPDKKNPYMAFL